MILWCAYCQTCLGEKEPFDVFTMSHSICDQCLSKGIMQDDAAVMAILPIADLYRDLRAAMLGSDRALTAVLLQKGLDSGLKPIDLAWGILQPLLYEVGRLWSLGQLSIAEEHKVTQQVEDALGLLFERQAELRSRRGSPKPFVVLTSAAGNYHSIGLRLLEFQLAVYGIDSQVFLPGLPPEEVVRLVAELRPVVLGISVSLLSQMASVHALRDALQALPPDQRPRLILGGSIFRQDLALPDLSGYTIVHDLRHLGPVWAQEQADRRA